MFRFKKLISLCLILIAIATMAIGSSSLLNVSAAGTGIGLAEHALNAYYSGWSYVYGGCSAGAVDCSGLIYMYSGAGSRFDMMGSSYETGSTSYGIPNIHGLGLYRPGHVGVYVGSGMAVDARGEDYGVCYESAGSFNWTNWFKVAGVSYPTDGWEYFNGSYYYYEDGEYLTDTYIEIDGISYYLDYTGASSSTPGDTSGVVDDSSSSSSSSSNVMQFGDYGDNVIELQLRLTELGFYNGPVTGYFGEQTEAAYIRFQKAAGVYVDGIAGEGDREILYSDDAPTGNIAEVGTSIEETDVENEAETENEIETETTTESTTFETFVNGSYNDDVYKIQTELANLGYFTEEATGYYGSLTESAVTQFQLDNGLEATGEVDEITYTTLFSSKALENSDADKSSEKNIVRNPNAIIAETTTPPQVIASAPVINNQLTSPTEATEIVLKSAQLASKALEGINVDTQEAAKTSKSNGSFLVWFIVMIAFMSAAFWIVFSTEKKKKKAKFERIKARANRNW